MIISLDYVLIHCPNRAVDKILRLRVLLQAAGSVVTSVDRGSRDMIPTAPTTR